MCRTGTMRFAALNSRLHDCCERIHGPGKGQSRRIGITPTVVSWGLLVILLVAVIGPVADAQGIVPVETDGNDTSEYYHLEMGASAEVKEREMQELRQRLAGTTLR
uniref:Uncharacterized protein n=1 Tax=Anopheles maculatus TaxID=74869 RepID=A0A182T5A1_9DIPT